MAKPEYREIMVQDSGGELRPLAPVSEIIKNLFQGMRPSTYVGYDFVINCERHFARTPISGYKRLFAHIPMDDDEDFVIPEVDIKAFARDAKALLDAGMKVLVHCTGGLNRSSLVTCEILKLCDHTPQEAVTVLRARRDPFCLCNRTFERWVLEEQLPTAETSTFRIEELESDGPVLGLCPHGVDLDKEFCEKGCRV